MLEDAAMTEVYLNASKQRRVRTTPASSCKRLHAYTAVVS